MKEREPNRAGKVIAFALIIILGFTAIGNIGRIIFGSAVKTAVHETKHDLPRDFSQQDWEQFDKEMESLGEELGAIGEEIGKELGPEFEQLGKDLEREFESIDVEVDPDINVEVEVGR